MTTKEKITLLEETLDIEEGTLKEDTMLEDVEEYDSMAKLALIVLFDEEFNKKVSGDTIKSFKTVFDILQLMD